MDINLYTFASPYAPKCYYLAPTDGHRATEYSEMELLRKQVPLPLVKTYHVEDDPRPIELDVQGVGNPVAHGREGFRYVQPKPQQVSADILSVCSKRTCDIASFSLPARSALHLIALLKADGRTEFETMYDYRAWVSSIAA